MSLSSEPYIYDVVNDEVRPVTQDDLDKMDMALRRFALRRTMAMLILQETNEDVLEAVKKALNLDNWAGGPRYVPSPEIIPIAPISGAMRNGQANGSGKVSA
jgi:hypothetical protein